MDRDWYKIIIDIIGLTIGVFLLAIGLVFFLEPNAIAPGGVQVCHCFKANNRYSSIYNKFGY